MLTRDALLRHFREGMYHRGNRQVHILISYVLLVLCNTLSNIIIISSLVMQILIATLSYVSTAICTNPCQNGGTCTAPDTCTCDVRWTGMQCETGMPRKIE